MQGWGRDKVGSSVVLSRSGVMCCEEARAPSLLYQMGHPSFCSSCSAVLHTDPQVTQSQQSGSQRRRSRRQSCESAAYAGVGRDKVGLSVVLSKDRLAATYRRTSKGVLLRGSARAPQHRMRCYLHDPLCCRP